MEDEVTTRYPFRCGMPCPEDRDRWRSPGARFCLLRMGHSTPMHKSEDREWMPGAKFSSPREQELNRG